MTKRDLEARLAVLLWQMMAMSQEVAPSDSACLRILALLSAFRLARTVCCHRGADLWTLPPTILGRIARSTSCVLDSRVCITMVIYSALTVPAVLALTDPAGFVSLPVFSWNSACSLRLVLVSYLSSNLATEICSIITQSGYLKLLIKDSQQYACLHPLASSALRAALCVGGRRRALRHWRVPLCTDPVVPRMRLIDDGPLSLATYRCRLPFRLRKQPRTGSATPVLYDVPLRTLPADMGVGLRYHCELCNPFFSPLSRIRAVLRYRKFLTTQWCRSLIFLRR